MMDDCPDVLILAGETGMAGETGRGKSAYNSPMTFYFLPVEVQSTPVQSVQAACARAVQSKGEATH